MNRLPDLNRLGVFHRVFELESVSRAAEALQVTRSAVSQNIVKLEEELGTALFTRNGRRMLPTDAARSLRELVAPFVEGLKERAARSWKTPETLTGSVGITVPLDLLIDLVLPCVAEFSKRHPAVTFRINHGQERLAEALASGEIDLALSDTPLLGARSTVLLQKRLQLCCSRDYFKRHFKGRKATLQSILDGDFISTRPRGEEIQTWMFGSFGKKIELPLPVLHVDSTLAISRAIEKGMGMGLLSEPIEPEVLKLGHEPIKSVVYLLVPKGRDSTPAKEFRKWLMKQSRK